MASSLELEYVAAYVSHLEDKYVVGLVTGEVALVSLLATEESLRLIVNDKALDIHTRHGAEHILNKVCSIIPLIQEDLYGDFPTFSICMGVGLIGMAVYLLTNQVV